MRAVVQRVSHASVTVDGRAVGDIGQGICVFLGVGPDDDDSRARRLARRVAGLRIFGDQKSRMNLDVGAAGGEALVVSQFTLYADASRGHRPSFIKAGPPELAIRMCDIFCAELRAGGLRVATGEFGARMRVSLENDGPVTLVLSGGEGPWPADAG